jgi:hypothetical protein
MREIYQRATPTADAQAYMPEIKAFQQHKPILQGAFLQGNGACNGDCAMTRYKLWVGMWVGFDCAPSSVLKELLG